MIINIISCSILFTPTSHAEENIFEIQLVMTPNICVLSEKESHCQDIFAAEWRAKNNKSYSLCLYQRGNKIPVECWQDASIGKAQFKQTIAKTTIFELRDIKSKTLLGQEAFEVINAQKKYQRSRRNPWSFF